ncbi:uncharacterized protein [Lepeophtheirus salmonis]|uniref:uncharacterized protein n=1 Tax=Lepeophtheirus salmonis TaxID=72036 RepID=UPI003AF345BC
MGKSCFIHFCIVILLNKPLLAIDVLLIAGGVYRNLTTQLNVPLSSVEIVGPTGSCEISPLPEPRQSLSVVRVGNSVFACGGFYIYERTECFEYIPEIQRWLMGPRLGKALIFSGAVSFQNRLVLIGGRRFNYGTGSWDYLKDIQVWDSESKLWIHPYPPLPYAIADACVFTYGSRVIIIGGSNGMYQYSDDPGRVWVLVNNTWRDDIVPPILGPRMWHSCEVIHKGNEVGFMLVGGYYNGFSTMYWPLDGPRHWEWMGPLTEDRKWKPAIGLVNGQLIVATGGNYGDNRIEVYDGERHWTLRRDKLRYKREYAGHTKVPHYWFPHCRF